MTAASGVRAFACVASDRLMALARRWGRRYGDFATWIERSTRGAFDLESKAVDGVESKTADPIERCVRVHARGRIAWWPVTACAPPPRCCPQHAP